jgi:PhzF family phenazine biosynthesis protein
MKPSASVYNYVHCDVFATCPYSGNSLAVFTDSSGLNADQMLSITQELRHFESIFLSKADGRISARVFDQFEELPFAGHPLIGAACTMHKLCGINGERVWQIGLQGGRNVSVTTTFNDGRYIGSLNQGRPGMIAVLSEVEKSDIADAFNLALTDMSDLPLEVISTGLKYLVVPVTGGLASARITVPNLEDKLAKLGAEFAYLFDVNAFEGRHWNNDGIMEDVATGSAAGVIGAYALKHGLVQSNQRFVLKQGHFMGRPSEILVTASGSRNDISRVIVAGEVAFVGSGELAAPIEFR